MATPLPDVTAAVASLRARWGAAARGGRGAGPGARPPLEVGSGRAATRADPTGPTTGSSRPGSPRSTRSSGPAACLDRPASRSAATARAADDARPPGRRRGPGRRVDRGLARPVAQLRPGRGRRPGRPPRVARGHHPGDLDEGLAIAGSLLAGRSVDLLVLDLPGGRLAGRTSPPGSADRLGRLAALARRPETLLVVLEPPARRWPRDRRRRGDRHPARARPAVVDPARARRRRPADGGAGRPQPRRPTGASGRPSDPLRRGRRAGRLPPPRRPPRRRPSPPHPSPRHRRTDHRDATPPSPPTTPPPRPRPGASPPSPFPAGPLVLGGQPWDPGRSSTRARTPGRWASGAGCRSGAPIGSSRRRPSSTPSPRPTGRPSRPPSRRSPRSARGSPAPPTRSIRVRAVRGPDRRSRGVVGPGAGPRRAAGRAALGARDAGGPGRASPARASPRPWPPSLARPDAPILVPPGGEAEFLAPPGRAAHPDPRSGPGSPGSACAGSAVAELAAIGAGRPVRRGGRADPGPAHGRGGRAVPATPRSGAPRPRPADRARRRRASSRSASSSIASPGADRAARGARAGGRAGPAASRPGPRLRAGRDAAEIDVEQRFPEPTADAEAIERLLFARLERTPPPAAVARLELELDGTAPAAGQQLPLFAPQAATAPGSTGSSPGSP